MNNYRAMVIPEPGAALVAIQREIPAPADGEVLIEVFACGVCRTDLHILDGEIPARYPIVPGHEVVGRVMHLGTGVTGLAIGQRVGVPWLGQTCGRCAYCRAGQENLCDHPQFTGCTRDGGYASHVVADARYCFAIPPRFSDTEAAPLLCAGLIGWRAFRLAGAGKRIGLYGFGAAAHILAQIASWQGREVYAFTRKNDTEGQDFARDVGCFWAGGSDELPPELLDAAIIFASVGALVPSALHAVRKGGNVVCAGIHMSDIPSFPYAALWGERCIRSVANLTRQDGIEFLEAADRAKLRPAVELFGLADANLALARLRNGQTRGAAVLVT